MSTQKAIQCRIDINDAEIEKVVYPHQTLWRPCQGGGGGSHVAHLNLKRLVSMFITACRLLSALPSLSQFGRGRLSLVVISFYALPLLFGPCRLSEFTLAGPHCAGGVAQEGLLN